MMDRRQNTLLTFLVAAITFVVFSRLISCDFTWWDDQNTIHHNPLLNPPTWAAVRHYWTAMGENAPMAIYIPLTYTLWAGLAVLARRPIPDSYGIWLNPHVFHGANVVLHALTVVVVFRLLLLLLKSPRAAFIGALLFAVHPLQVEPVGWVSGTKDVLCGLLSVIALQQYIACAAHSLKPKSILRYWIATTCLVLAMLSKPTAIIVPVLAGTIDRWLLQRPLKEVIRSLWPWLALMIPCAIITFTSQPASFVSPLAAWTRPFIAADALAFYLWKLVWPIHLAVNYGRRPQVVWQHGWYLYTWLVPMAVGIVLFITRKVSRIPLIAAALFCIPLLPVLGLLPFQYQYQSTVADHYLYLAMLGPALLAGWFVMRLEKTYFAVGGILILLAVRSVLQEPFWQNATTLSAHAVSVNPNSFGPWEMLGAAQVLDGFQLESHGNPAAKTLFTHAADSYERAIKLNPQSVGAHRNLAVAYRQLGQKDKALNQMREIITLQPTLPAGLRDDPVALAFGLDFYGDTSAALAMLDHILITDPGNQHAREVRASIRAHPAF